MIGVDIIEIDRIADCVERFGPRFLRRVYTDQELSYCSDRVGSLAARWAAKEAVSKALGTGIGEIGWRDIEIVNDGRLRPSVSLYGAAAARAGALGVSKFAVSLSHTREHAIAFVVVEEYNK